MREEKGSKDSSKTRDNRAIEELSDEEYKTIKEELQWPDKFPYDEPDAPGISGKVYQWIKRRYANNRKKWVKSDIVIWKAWCFVIPTWIGYLIFAGLFGWLFLKLYDKYGIGKVLSLAFVLILWRMNVMIHQLSEMNKKLK